MAVEKKPTVKIVQSGSKGMFVVFNKPALTAMREGKTFPIQMVSGDKKMQMIFCRDTAYAKIEAHAKAINDASKKGGESKAPPPSE